MRRRDFGVDPACKKTARSVLSGATKLDSSTRPENDALRGQAWGFRCRQEARWEGEQAVDRTLQYVYATWMGCKGIAFARSLDRGKTFQTPISVPGSIGSNVNVWDPAVTVGADGTVYSAFMIAKGGDWCPWWQPPITTA